MSRRFTGLLLAVCLILSSVVVAFAAESDERYNAALEALSASGLSSGAQMAMNSGSKLPAELNVQEEGEELSLVQLAARALQLRQERRQAQDEAVAEAVAEAAILVQYDGVIITAETTFYTSPDEESEAIRTLPVGKVAVLLDLENGWYQVAFDNNTGYLPAEDCEPVQYADYADTRAASMVIEDLIAYAYTYLGTPYVFGGTSYRGIDCSAFTRNVYAHVGYSLPRVVTAQYRSTRRVSDSELLPGDLLYFNTDGSGMGHIGIYLGDGMFIHSGSITGVAIRSLSESYFARTYVCATRVID